MATKLFCDRCGVEIINGATHYAESGTLGVHFVGRREADLCDICREDLKVFMDNNQIAQKVWVLNRVGNDEIEGIFDSEEKAENAASVLTYEWKNSVGVEVDYTVSEHAVR